jgi:5-methylcytosine-specific restriction endonuclease McrA
MKPKEYLVICCYNCGWGICAFLDSDIYLRDIYLRYKTSKQHPRCPYCKTRRSYDYLSSTSVEPKMLTIREPPMSRKPISKQQREETLKKYGGKCVICGSTENLQIDHIIPVISNGTNDADNLQVLCKACNTSKSDGDRISKKREMIIHIKQSCSHPTSKKRVSMAEIARVSGVSYYNVLNYQDAIRRELGLLKKNANPPENAGRETQK